MLVTTACDKGSRAPVQREKPVGPAVPVVADDASVSAVPAGGPVDLFRAVPSQVLLSSRVKNKSILPEHIADQNRETAWNGATGKLVGSWIEISTDDTLITEVRMTVGHTGHGPKGEDYFTMNPRIRQVSIDGKTFDLDITNRELQTVRIDPAYLVRLTITQVEPGSKKSWREVAVSELEAWGPTNPGWAKPPNPLTPSVSVDGESFEGEDPCAGVEQEAAEGEASGRYKNLDGPGGEDHNYPPDCGTLALPEIRSLPAPWSSANAGCRINDSIYGPQDCMINFRDYSRTASLHYSTEHAKAEISVSAISERDVIPGGRPELVVRFKHNDNEFLGVCRAEPLACTATFDATGVDDATALAKQKLVFDH